MPAEENKTTKNSSIAKKEMKKNDKSNKSWIRNFIPIQYQTL